MQNSNEHLNRYKIEKMVGKGGVAEVYKALDRKTNNIVAIKRLTATTENARKRFHKEYRFLRAVKHPNLIDVYDYIECNNETYMVLEFVHGKSLAEIITKHKGILSLAEQVAIAANACRGLEVLNAGGIIHRDIKPENIMVNDNTGVVKILDLGIGKNIADQDTSVTTTHGFIGTTAYASPEQGRNQISENSDVFSLGTTLYQFFLWEDYSPFFAQSNYATIYKLINEHPTPLYEKIHKNRLSLSSDNAYKRISKILRQAMEKDPEKRCQMNVLADSFCSISNDLVDASRLNDTQCGRVTKRMTPEFKKILDDMRLQYQDEDLIPTKKLSRSTTKSNRPHTRRRQRQIQNKSFPSWAVAVACVLAIFVFVVWSQQGATTTEKKKITKKVIRESPKKTIDKKKSSSIPVKRETNKQHNTQQPLITGIYVPAMKSFDLIISDFIKKCNIPGGAVAVVQHGRLIYARGFGYANKEKQKLVEPTSLFRITDLSMPITAVAIMKLIQEKKLTLNDKAFRILSHLKPPSGKQSDERLSQITIRHLLEHSGGWDSRQKGEPMMTLSRKAADAFRTSRPANVTTIIRYMMGQPLDFPPGTKHVRSHLGYCILGRIIEKVTGVSYEKYVAQNIFKPAGIKNMHLAKTRLRDQRFDEVIYYDYPALRTTSIFPDETKQITRPYGFFNIQEMDASTAWTASVIDMLRFVMVIDGRGPQRDILNRQTTALMTAKPLCGWQDNFYYAKGWMVRPIERNWWHSGFTVGSSAFVGRFGNGAAWVGFFNFYPYKIAKFSLILDQTLWRAYLSTKSFPEHDLFEKY
ncbi:protein kinase domain-containing protein [Candidatus Uabimicrobium amorphum]|uniref:D-aminoacylase n=1 Tax=Uabimicrobium amorphum TaxID=2596890 RepID=A0A5S9IIP0_UABAM|nr:serine hydrolase [Candidatus Uabimicrobium amorphum]BBM82102.1 D-aminoacylase [Candidatus Uabimicrobium amorphum]